jgi:hypothetical protein
VRYGLGTLATVGQYWLDRLGIRRSPLFERTAPRPAPTPGTT